MDTSGISVIIITQNRAEELKKTIELLKVQKCSVPYEILIIDQASTDKTEEIFTNVESPFHYIRLDKNYGVSGGRNRGAEYAKYDNMVFIDDDANFVSEKALERISDVMNNSKCNLFAFQILNSEGSFYNWPYKNSLKNHSDETFMCGTYIGCGHAIKKSFFEKVNGYSDILFFWGEESELVMKSVGYDNQVVQYVGEIKIIHRVKGNGRNTYDAKRFYYQVRNRMYLYKELIPSLAFGYRVYYQCGYFIKAIKNKWMDEYRKGLKDSKKMKAEYPKKLTLKQFLLYNKYCKKG